MKCLVTYDITDNKKRQKIIKELEKLGVRVQYSCFEIEGKKREIEKVLTKISQIIDKTDSVFVFELSKECQKQIVKLGKQAEFKTIL
jgi:CRISPR-associated protein Cas2